MPFKSLFDFQDYFKTDNDCLNFLKEKRFSNGVYCLHCNDKHVYECEDKLYKCGKCKKRFSIRKGTIFDNSRVPLKKWFVAMFLIDISSKGISSVQLAKQLGVTQKTAWFMAQRIRQSYNESRNKIAGDVEIDETYVGGKEKNKHYNKKTKGSQGRNSDSKEIVIGSIQRNVYGNKKLVNVKHIENTKVKTLKKYIKENIYPKANIISDDYVGYKNITPYRVNHSEKEYIKEGCIYTNNIENFWSIFKRGYIGVYHYMSAKHLQRYLNEYAFRYNYKNNKFLPMFKNINSVLRYKDLIDG